ncbi:MAG: 3-hydroxyacyl-CoA dehydrogenase family protein, partial [Hyphomicrobiales bacterium]
MTKAAVVGMGTMGPGIAATLARAGMTVRCYDASAEARERAPAGIKQATGVLAALGTPERGTHEVAMTDSLAACVDGAKVVVETVPEKLDI